MALSFSVSLSVCLSLFLSLTFSPSLSLPLFLSLSSSSFCTGYMLQEKIRSILHPLDAALPSSIIFQWILSLWPVANKIEAVAMVAVSRKLYSTLLVLACASICRVSLMWMPGGCRYSLIQNRLCVKVSSVLSALKTTWPASLY